MGRGQRGWSEEYLQPCGTTAAYRRHYRHGEKPCERCRQAEALRPAPARQPAARHARYIASQPVPIVHYGRHQAACGRSSRYGVTVTAVALEVSCLLCLFSRAFRDALDACTGEAVEL